MSFFKNLDEDVKKKLKLCFIVIGAVIVVLFLLSLIFRLMNRKENSYADIEDTIKNATISYFEADKTLLPATDFTQATVSVETLVQKEQMKELSKLVPKGVTCTGEGMVIKHGEKYSYGAKLDCGNTYQTQNISDYMAMNVVSSGNGIYAMNNSYVYRGENVDNYVLINGKYWQIVKVDGNNVMTLITQEVVETAAWDNRYNVDYKKNYGYNDYNLSRVKETLEELYDGSSYQASKRLFQDSDKNLFIPYLLCDGSRSLTDTTNDGGIECNSTVPNQVIGFLPMYDYINASLDSNCHSGSDRACQNYNYLYQGDTDWWTMTKVPGSNSEVFALTSGGIMEANVASTRMNLKPIIFMDAKTTRIKSGTGSSTDPFILQ